MGARVDTGKENQNKGNKNNIYNITIYYSLMTWIICHRISSFNAEIIHATKGYEH